MCALQVMERTKGKQVVFSNTDLYRELIPPPPKKQKGISINNPLEASRAQQTNPLTSTSNTLPRRK